ncbi:peroxiredoxin [Marinitoga sp. 1135]|uniref:thioredoxin-dependent peroxiredoxin n=1 Tax=Marinitoga piezophila (strain DSM 14283 / JCM 11233 / KA3) TaxID=443254 RepID=H2J707_MARPK|nr:MULTISPECIES: thioredoxin-dependent thiol peroxidase [Marinitoga]AEX86377.1 Peroxiredoxin [Marinitoga piezophila KA3]APT76770.1 peroxiredoxin [Marinitoga sp. 1137]NUU96540.1 peroxiredoxin [Marinitoga sp. 1135]NUU98471.1 peroxiredoxin [Marinitoga sp. 1138]
MKYLKYNVGDVVDFTLLDDEGKEFKLNDYRGKWVVVYFYPKDNTKGCTTEAIDFTEMLDEFKKLNAEIVGISPDGIDKHQKFKTKHNLKVKLLSDEEKKVLEDFGVWQLKKMYGREYYGVVRTTVLVDPEGKIAHVWEKVRVKGHVEDVLNKLKELQK